MLDLIMCIDDDPITLMLFKKTANKAMFAQKIITALNGEEAIQLIDEKSLQLTKPQLIFLDLNMPVMGGWEFLDSLTKSNYFDTNNTKIIILTSSIDPKDINKSKAYPNVIAFLSKPITVEMLFEMLIKIKE